MGRQYERGIVRGLHALTAVKTGEHIAVQFCPYYVKDGLSIKSPYNYPLVLALVEYCNFKNDTISSLVRDRLMVDRANAATIQRVEEERDALRVQLQLQQVASSSLAGKKTRGKGGGKGKG